MERVFFFNNGKTQSISYNLINNDSVVYIQPIEDKDNAEYLKFKKNYSTDISFSTPKIGLSGGFRYIKDEQINSRNGLDTLFVFYGRDYGFADSLYYYFDKNIYLRKITSENGNILYVDKAW